MLAILRWGLLASLLVACRDDGGDTPPDVVAGLEEVVEIAGEFDDVPEDPIVYGYAAAIFNHSNDKLLYEHTAEELDRRHAAGDGELLATFRDRELGFAAEEEVVVAELETRASRHGYPLPDEDAVVRVMDAVVYRRLADDVEKQLEAYEAGTTSLSELEAFHHAIALGLADDVHGIDVARRTFARELDPTRAAPREQP